MKNFHARRFLGRSLLLLCLCLALVFSVNAQDDLSSDAEYCFSGAEFAASGEIEGVMLREVPDPELCQLLLGERVLRAGDFLPEQTFSQLVLRPCAQDNSVAVISYMAVKDGRLQEATRFTMNIKSAADEKPAAQDSELETYKNIPNQGTLQASDPEGAPLSYTVVEQPRRGSVTVEPDGSFVYTPARNKVGEDAFTFTATDPKGNVSDPATVKIMIKKPVDDATFSDMGKDSQFTAMWLRNNGLFGGELLAEELCFCPEKTVTRGEFLVMSMRLAGINPDIGLVTSGFSDQKDAPAWMQPYMVSAMRRGIVSGIPSEDGLLFRPNEPVTREQAAVMLAGALRLDKAAEVFAAQSSTPVWAQSSVAALMQAGVLPPENTTAVFTRAQAAELLYRASTLGE